MFGFFSRSSSSSKCPVTEERRLVIDKSFNRLLRIFGADYVKSKTILLPREEDFPFEFVGDEENAYEILDVLAPQMDLNIDDIEIDFYTEAETEIKTGGAFHDRIFLQAAENADFSAGLYWGKQADGKYHIGLETKHLNNAQQVIATLAHELAHVKLLGEERIKKNDETLTDLATIVFGLGVFGANTAFQFRNSFDSWGYSRTGYLTQMDWGYALALFAYIREEKAPGWINFLTLNVKSDFRQSERFIRENEDIILKSPGKNQEKI
jgi:hypothetical protein